jgi:N-acylneuraminate cytidylyltransferase
MVRTVNHCIKKMKLEDYDAILLLQPTCPLRIGVDIDEAISLLEEAPDADSVISFVDVGGYHPARMRVPDSFGYMRKLPGYEMDTPGASRQSYPACFIRAGCIYLTRTDVLMSGSFEGENCAPLFVDPMWHANIDSEADFGHADYLIMVRERALLKGEFVCTTRFTRAASGDLRERHPVSTRAPRAL